MHFPNELLKDYKINTLLGNGSFASVRLSTHRLTSELVAVKIIDKSKLDARTFEKIAREATVLRQLVPHPHIITLYQYIDASEALCLVLEYGKKGDMLDYLIKNGPFSEEKAAFYFAQLASAVSHCHKNGVVHRDIKTENLLFIDDKLELIKLADFGFSNFYEPDNLLTTWCGSPTHAAPEIFEAKEYVGPEVDIWALGIVLYVFLCACLPFKGENLPQLRHCVLNGLYDVPSWISEDCRDLLGQLLQVKAEARPTIEQVLNHKWLSSRPVDSASDKQASKTSLTPENEQKLCKFMQQNYSLTAFEQFEVHNPLNYSDSAFASYVLERRRLLEEQKNTVCIALQADTLTNFTELDTLHQGIDGSNSKSSQVSEEATKKRNSLEGLWNGFKQSPQRFARRLSNEWSSLNFERLAIKSLLQKQKSETGTAQLDNAVGLESLPSLKKAPVTLAESKTASQAQGIFLKELQNAQTQRRMRSNTVPTL